MCRFRCQSCMSAQAQICKQLESCRKICGAYRCLERPEYIGQLWGDIFLHVSWFIGIMWWLPIIIGFICCCFMELHRRAKLVEVCPHATCGHCLFIILNCRLGLISSGTGVTGFRSHRLCFFCSLAHRVAIMLIQSRAQVLLCTDRFQPACN